MSSSQASSRDYRVFGIVVGAGSGSRYGRLKQLDLLAGKPIWQRSVETAAAVCDMVVAVVPPELVDAMADSLRQAGLQQAGLAEVSVVAGGATRSASVRCGIQALLDCHGPEFQDRDIAVVHDAVRPLATAELFCNVIDAVATGADCAIPGLAVTDTIRHETQGIIDRSQLKAIQTPQAFVARQLQQAHESEPEASDDSALVEAMGARVELVAGDPANLKLTYQSDLAVAEAVLRQQEAAEVAEPVSKVAAGVEL